MRRIELSASLIWGALLAFVLLGAFLTGSIPLIVYLVCALAVWLWAFILARRRGPSASRLALTAIPLSMLGPLAIVPVARRRVKNRQRPAAEHPSEAPPVTPARAPRLEPTPQPTGRPPRVRPPAAPVRRSRHPGSLLAALVVGSVLAFPLAAIVFTMLIVLGGATLLTAHDIRGVALASGIVAGVALVVSAGIWWRRTLEVAMGTRRLGWVLIAVAGAVIAGATLLFMHGTSPRNLNRPTVLGPARLGAVLRSEHGQWTAPGAPLTFDYQWQACERACVDIADATEDTYVPGDRDLRKRIRVAVTASPSGGVLVFSSEWSYSKETAPIVP